MLKFFLEIGHRIKRTIEMLNKSCKRERIFFVSRKAKKFERILSIDCVLISTLIFGSFAVGSTSADDVADGDDETPL